MPGAVFQPPGGNRTLGRYDVDRDDVMSSTFIQVSVFATVYRTMYLFEQPKVLGRKVRWGFVMRVLASGSGVVVRMQRRTPQRGGPVC